MSHKKKKRKQLRCVACNNDVDKRDMVSICNLRSARSACKTCIPGFKEGSRYMWNKEKTKLVEGYTQSELTEMKHAEMTPEEVLRDKAQVCKDGQAALAMLSSFARMC